jgi:phage portal protein BeeE
MAFWNRKESRAQTTGLATPASWFTEALTSVPSPSGKRVTVSSAIGLAPVWAAVSLIAEQVGQLPLKVYKEVDGDRVEARGHRAWGLLHDKPNDHTPADRFWSTVTTQLLLYGNAFVRKHRDDLGLVNELTLMNPSHMLVYWDGDQRIKEYRYQPLNGQLQTLTPDEVLHIFGLSLDGVLGESVISRCKASFGAAMARDEFEGSFYKRGANLSGVLQHPSKISPDAKRNIKDTFSALYAGSDKAHGTPLLEEGMTFQAVGSPLRDLEFVAADDPDRHRGHVQAAAELPGRLLRRLADVRDGGVQPDPVRVACHRAVDERHRIGIDGGPVDLPAERVRGRVRVGRHAPR